MFNDVGSAKRLNLALPLELVENIIDLLSSDSRTLKTAALVSSIWLPVCRMHLFRRIVLHWCNDGLRRSMSLCALLTRNPDIAQYVREFSVHEGLIQEGCSAKFCFAHSSSLPKLLLLLPDLRLLEFRASTSTYWCELSRELVDSLLHAIVSICPLLDKVELGSWNFALQPRAFEALLNAISENVRTLVLTDIITPTAPMGMHRSGVMTQQRTGGLQRRMPLRFLTLNDGISLPFCTQWLNGKSAAIRSLRLSCSADQTSISEQLDVLGAHLEEFVLNIGTLRNNIPVNLSCNSRLRSLQLQASEHPPASSHRAISVSWLVDTLSTLRSFESLESLHVSLRIEAGCFHRLSMLDTSDWCRLDEILSQQRFPRLCTVTIGIIYQCHDGYKYIKEARTQRQDAGGSRRLYIHGTHNEARRICGIDYC